LIKSSVADSGCLSLIPDPDFYPTRIPDPKTARKERREKNLLLHLFLVDTNFTKIVNYFIFELFKNQIWANVQRMIELFIQKLSPSSQKYGFGIWDPRKTYPGPQTRGQKGTGSRIRIRNTD
jgi:hypothetical protein